MSSPEHGSLAAAGACAAASCAPAVWQQVPGSAFLKALNGGDETPGDVSYTSIYSLTDEVVPELPPPSTSVIEGARNVAIQDLCPGRPVNHVGMLTDPVAHALVLDALGHAGPADPSRVAASTCFLPLAPGLDAADFAYVQAVALPNAGASTLVTGPKTGAEPPLAPYVAGEQASASPPASGPQPAGSPPTQAPGTSASVRGSSLAATGARPSMAVALMALAAALFGGAIWRRLSALSG
jgi:hypothetical protein